MTDEANKCLGKEITLVKELPNKSLGKKKFQLVGHHDQGVGQIGAPTSYNPNDYSWGVWAILKAEDGEEISRINLKLILDTIHSGAELEFDY